MVTNDPSTGELSRRIDQIWKMLADLIGRNEYTEYQRGIERGRDEVQRMVDEIRHDHEADMAEMKSWVTDEFRKIHARSQWKINLWVGIFPTLAAVAGILVTIWLKKG